MNGTKSIMIVGVGGQGTLLASRILGAVLIDEGYDVKMSEVHGMSQRGGSVVTYVRYGDKVHSPIILESQADIIIAFEQLEALRYVSYLKKSGTLIVNTQKIDPMPVITGAAKYPEGILDKLKQEVDNVVAVDALTIAKEAGNVKAVNVALLGVLAKKMSIDKNTWQDALRKTVSEKFLEVNLKAFEVGFNI